MAAKQERSPAENIEKFAQQCANIFGQIRRDVIGQNEVVEGVVTAMIAGGNVLLEGVPGVGKTRLVRSLGRVFDLPFSRIQFTPDLMPADVTGTNIIVKDDKGNSGFKFQPGPIFSNIVLADEINRATPKTQSALLEAMQEHSVTVMGVSRKLNEPFFVLATQNPIEQDGTYPLPEAQMDRFMFKLIVEMPSFTELQDIVSLTQKTMAETADAACNGDELLAMRDAAKMIPVASDVMKYAIQLTMATHPDNEYAAGVTKKYVRFGASPRSAQALISAAKVRALMHGRFNVSYGDINDLAVLVFRHRLKANFEAITERVTTDQIVEGIVKEVAAKLEIPVASKDKNKSSIAAVAAAGGAQAAQPETAAQPSEPLPQGDAAPDEVAAASDPQAAPVDAPPVKEKKGLFGKKK
jgi:MoxR-like ATPase